MPQLLKPGQILSFIEHVQGRHETIIWITAARIWGIVEPPLDAVRPLQLLLAEPEGHEAATLQCAGVAEPAPATAARTV